MKSQTRRATSHIHPKCEDNENHNEHIDYKLGALAGELLLCRYQQKAAGGRVIIETCCHAMCKTF